MGVPALRIELFRRSGDFKEGRYECVVEHFRVNGRITPHQPSHDPFAMRLEEIGCARSFVRCQLRLGHVSSPIGRGNEAY